MQKLVAKIYLFLATKIIYADSAEMENNFYKKIYNINLCNFWQRIWSGHNTHHTQKLAIEDLWFLRYCRSRFFTFLFFMQKLSGTSSGKNNKSGMIFHNESNKIRIAFFRFVYNFLRILQDSANLKYYLSYHFAVRPLNLLQFHNCALLLRISPQQFSSPCNVTPGAGGRRGSPDSGELACARGRERAGRVSNPHGPDSGGRLSPGGGRREAHRRPAAVAAASRAAARPGLG
jgi:hypothetical protein